MVKPVGHLREPNFRRGERTRKTSFTVKQMAANGTANLIQMQKIMEIDGTVDKLSLKVEEMTRRIEESNRKISRLLYVTILMQILSMLLIAALLLNPFTHTTAAQQGAQVAQGAQAVNNVLTVGG